jgi:hypothetical protein
MSGSGLTMVAHNGVNQAASEPISLGIAQCSMYGGSLTGGQIGRVGVKLQQPAHGNIKLP